MLKKLSFIISSTFLTFFKSEEKLTINSVVRNARKSQYIYDGLYHLTEDLLKLTQNLNPTMAYVLEYAHPVASGDGEEIHFFFVTRRKLYYFTKSDYEEVKPTMSVFPDTEVPVLILMELIARKNMLTAIRTENLLSYMDTVEFNELDSQWEVLKDYVASRLKLSGGRELKSSDAKVAETTNEPNKTQK